MTETALERKEHDHRVIQELLDERQQLWTLFTALSGQKAAGSATIEARLREFCQVLVDYISLGHFEMYPRLTDLPERRERVQALANSLYPAFTKATDAAVDFNDKYESLTGPGLERELEADLAQLGKALTSRFELEDRLVEAMAD